MQEGGSDVITVRQVLQILRDFRTKVNLFLIDVFNSKNKECYQIALRKL